MTELELFSHLGIDKGITSIIGGGGKTTLLTHLGLFYSTFSSVILTTSTHIYPPNEFPYAEQFLSALNSGECITIGTKCTDGKITLPKQSFFDLSLLCDYVFIEADGSKGLPVKIHASYEPVIPNDSRSVIAVLGLDAIGCPVRDVVHRYNILCERMNLLPEQIVTPEICARLLLSYPKVTGVLLNKADLLHDMEPARVIAKLLPYPVAIHSFVSEYPITELWRNGECLLS